MVSYSQGLLDSSNNYGIVKTETLFGFGPSHENYVDRINTSEPLKWILTHGNFAPRSLQVSEENLRGFQVEVTTPKPRTHKKGLTQEHTKKKRKAKGAKKCIVKFLNKGGENQGGGGGKKRRGNKGMQKMQRKYMMPLILGLLAAKSLLIPIALKALAFLSAKGLMMGFFSTVMASVLSLKGMFDHSHGYQNRKDDTKTQVEIIQVPSKSEDHVYYNDEHYRRGDLVRGDYRSDLAREDYVRGNGVRGDYIRGDPVRGDVIRGDPVRGDYIRGDPVRGDVIRGDTIRGEFIRGAFRGDYDREDLGRGDFVGEGDIISRGDLVPVIVNKN